LFAWSILQERVLAVLGQWLVLLHVISAFAFVAGLVGREVSRAYARRQEKLDPFTQLMGLSRWFERNLVMHGSHAIIIFGTATAWVRGWPLFGVLQGSSINWVFVSLLLYLTTVPLIPLIFVPRGKRLRERLTAAQAEGVITPELRAAMNDPVVRAAHIGEEVVIAVIIYLMVMKPF
jgi:hypothetical protein